MPRTNLGSIRTMGLAVAVLTAAGIAAFAARPETATGRGGWPESPPPEGTTPIPVLSRSPTPLRVDVVKVCTAVGETPQSYTVLSEVCWGGDEHCTLFVAVPTRDYIRIREFDVAKPPTVVFSDDVCTGPAHKMFSGLADPPR